MLRIYHPKTLLNLVRARLFRCRIPMFIGLALTYNCNYKCSYCYVREMEEREELSTKRAISLIDELCDLGAVGINFTGGEPLLRKDIGHIIRHAKSKRLRVGISSNGALVPQKVDEIKEINDLTVSFDGPAQNIQRDKRAFDDVVAAIKTAKEHRITISLYTVLTKNNINQLDSILGFAEQFDVRVMFAPIYQISRRGPDVESLSPDLEAYKQGLDQLLNAKKNHNKYIINSLSGLKVLRTWPGERNKKCVAGTIYCRVQPNGNVYRCSTVMQDVEGQNLIELGFKKAFKNIDTNVCRNCWCAHRIELNLMWGFNANAIMNFC